MQTIKDRVKTLRKAMRISQAELARRCEVAQPSIANIEGGRTLEIKGYLLERLARELNTTAGYILEGATDDADHEATMMQAEISAIFAKLSQEDRSALLRSARGMLVASGPAPSQLNPFPSLEKPRREQADSR